MRALLEIPITLSRIAERQLSSCSLRGVGLPVERTRKTWTVAPSVHPYARYVKHFIVILGGLSANMLSLDFLDDVRRMNKRQVGTQAHSLDFTAASFCALRANVSRYLRFDAQ